MKTFSSIYLFALMLAFMSPASLAKKKFYHYPEEGLNITFSTSMYMNLDEFFVSEDSNWLKQAKIHNGITPAGINNKMLDGKFGASVNLNYAHRIDQLKLQPYLSFNPFTLIGIMYMGVLTEYLIGDYNGVVPSVGLDTRILTTHYELGGVIVGVPFTLKRFVNKSVAISGLIEPSIWLNTTLEKKFLSLRAQFALHYFFKK